MTRLRQGYGAACIVALLCLSPAAAYWQSRQQVSVGGAPGYVGPGDIVSGAIGYWSPYRCYNNAYSGSVADIVDESTGLVQTTITCATGGVIAETINPLSTTCVVTCRLKKLYDQSGSTACGGAACHLTTAGSLPVITLNCLGSFPCSNPQAAGQCVYNTSAPTNNLPYTLMVVVKPDTTNDGRNALASDNNGGFGGVLIQNNATWRGYNGSSIDDGATSSAVFQVVQYVVNGASPNSSVSLDGSLTTGNSGTQKLSDGSGISFPGGGAISTCANSSVIGKYLEAGIWPSAITSGNQTSISANIHSYWGF